MLRTKVGVIFFATTMSALAINKPANPRDYSLTVTVKCSYSRPVSTQLIRIGALINGQMLELSTGIGTAPLMPGDYKMRLILGKHEKPYELDQSYEMLLPDGSRRTFYVSGVGEGICASAAGS